MLKKDVAKMAMKKIKTAWLSKEIDRSSESIGMYLSGKAECPKAVAIAWAVALGLEPLALWEEASNVQIKDRAS